MKAITPLLNPIQKKEQRLGWSEGGLGFIRGFHLESFFFNVL